MKKIVIGFLVILAGVLLLGFNMGFLPENYKHVVFCWQMLIIAIGVANLFSNNNKITGAILILVGSFFLAPKLIDVSYDLHQLFLPVILIAVGLIIIVKRLALHPFHCKDNSKLDSNYIDEANIFGGSKKKITAEVFKGGKITNIFGGTELDLTQTTLAEGKNVLEIACVFGGINMVVPADWVVHIEVTSIMGGFADKRYTNTLNSYGQNKVLYIKGTVIFGGGELRN